MDSSALNRRRLLQTGLLATAAVSFGPGFWREALAASSAQPGAGPYGPLQPPNANGIRLPAGFTSREIARSGQRVRGTRYVFPVFPDGQATFATPDGGWILVTNCEFPLLGGVSAIRFDAAGAIKSAYRILNKTTLNCAGGPTPWGTWLSCEEFDDGFTWECDPTGSRRPIRRAALGKFKHEAACVDPVEQTVYLTEDQPDGGLYRFVPADYPDLSKGRLEIACAGTSGRVVWRAVPHPHGGSIRPTRKQVPGSIRFARGEGMWFDSGVVYVATTDDETIHTYETATGKLGTLYRAADAPGTPLRGVDNVCVSASGDVFVAEDSYTNDPDGMDVCVITPEGEVARFLKLTGSQHFLPGALESETVGVCFDPSGTRMYVGSQRGFGIGVVYEITGPFRLDRPAGATPGGADVQAASLAPSAVVAAGAPLGLDVGKQIAAPALASRGLALGLTLDESARVRATLSISEPSRGGRRRQTTIASLDREVGAGPELLRLQPASGKTRRNLTSRRRRINASFVVRIESAGAPERVLRRSVQITPAPRPARSR